MQEKRCRSIPTFFKTCQNALWLIPTVSLSPRGERKSEGEKFKPHSHSTFPHPLSARLEQKKTVSPSLMSSPSKGEDIKPEETSLT